MPTYTFRADANQAWDVPTAIRVIHALRSENLQFMEQPFVIHDLDALAEVRKATSTYIMADESANSPLDVLNLAKKRAVDLISIYINNPGGILNAKKMAIVAEPAGIGCYRQRARRADWRTRLPASGRLPLPDVT